MAQILRLNASTKKKKKTKKSGFKFGANKIETENNENGWIYFHDSRIPTTNTSSGFFFFFAMDPSNWVLNLNTFRGDAISLDRRPNTLFPRLFMDTPPSSRSRRDIFFPFRLICECEAFYTLDFYYWKHIFRAVQWMQRRIIVVYFTTRPDNGNCCSTLMMTLRRTNDDTLFLHNSLALINFHNYRNAMGVVSMSTASTWSCKRPLNFRHFLSLPGMGDKV